MKNEKVLFFQYLQIFFKIFYRKRRISQGHSKKQIYSNKKKNHGCISWCSETVHSKINIKKGILIYTEIKKLELLFKKATILLFSK